VRPTLQEGNAKSYEVHIFDFTENIYNEQLKITFIEKIRDEKKFSDMDALTAQLTKDKNFTEQLFR
jgi:riboflavin kinase/FMN adenylyltransferase